MVEDQQLKELMDKIDQLIKALKDQGKFNYVNIEHADFQGPLVDKLDYHFDKLDVKEVSGALNLGTTFGVKVAEKKKKSESGGSGSGSSKKSKQDSAESTSQKKTQSQSSESTIPTSQSQSQTASQGSGDTHSQTQPQPSSQNTESSERKSSTNSLTEAGSKGVEEQKVKKAPTNQVQKQLAPKQKVKEPAEPKQESPTEQSNNDTGRVKLTFHRRDLINDVKVTKEPSNPSVYENRETDSTYKTRRKHPEEITENAMKEEAKSQKEIQPIEKAAKEQPGEPKMTDSNSFASTKKGFTVKLN